MSKTLEQLPIVINNSGNNPGFSLYILDWKAAIFKHPASCSFSISKEGEFVIELTKEGWEKPPAGKTVIISVFFPGDTTEFELTMRPDFAVKDKYRFTAKLPAAPRFKTVHIRALPELRIIQPAHS